jgi:hypothetical protein
LNKEPDAFPKGFDRLWEKFPWPADQPYPEVAPVGRSSTGLELIAEALAALERPPVVMEVGSEFGGSTRKFLELGAWVVSVDPWPDSYRGSSFPEIQPLLGAKSAMYDLFLSFCWPYREQLVAVRERSPEGPLAVRDAGVEVDLVYIDGDHRYDAVVRDLAVAHALFPSALVAGDDWLHEPTHKKYEGMQFPVQFAVRSWAAFNNMKVRTSGNTWLIDQTQPYNLAPLPPRFGPGNQDEAWALVNRRLKRMELAIDNLQRPTLPLRVARRAEALLRSRRR